MMIKGYLRPSANDVMPVAVVPYTIAELIKMGYILVVTADSTEPLLFRR